MSWFHEHVWTLVGKTYAPPFRGEMTGFGKEEVMKLAMGCTTYLWRCVDDKCNATRKEECLGKETINNNGE
jgi:hypothetical protein